MRARRAGLLALTLLCWTVPAAGQTRFSWPDTTVNLAAYASVEECQAAVSRVRSTLATQEALTTGHWRDTIAFAPAELTSPPPPPVTATARGCLTRFAAADSVPLTEFDYLVPLYLAAGWRDRLRTLVERRLAAIPPKAEGELAAVIDTLVSMYLAQGAWSGYGHAPQFALTEEVVTRYLPRVSDRVRRLKVYFRVMHANAADWVMDTAAIRRLAAPALPVLDSLTERERARLEEEFGLAGNGDNFAERVYALLNVTTGKWAFLDALRRSTAEFVKLKRDNWARATGQPPETYLLGMPIGERAPELRGDIWLGRSDSAPRPRPGRVSLVVFIANPDCLGPVVSDRMMYDSCAENLVPLRRLAQRFPALEVTLVAQSRGYFAYLKDSVTPAREAELTKRWLEAYGVHAALVMTATDFWRLPDPDGRRIDRDAPNRVNYSFGKSWADGAKNRRAFLVDQDGIVVHVRDINRYSEEEFGEMIEILLARGGGRS
ncbi:MAG TPA: hypothetical protein VNK43_04090 [Gemmatimonadales bacterium]|nr:hypothetical protein [Gemmatimonadales bacterium]